jgi:hypothetical protein
MIHADVSRESRRRSREPSPFARLAVVAAVGVGLCWLATDVLAGLRSGRDLDLHRRWVVCQYVGSGINPYPLALAALDCKYGPLGGGRVKPRVYAVPRLPAEEQDAHSPAGELLRSLGTPEAVYPPSADLVLSLTLGPLPERWVHSAGMLVNLLLLGAAAVLLGRHVPADSLSSAGVLLTLMLLLLWSPTRMAVLTGQFSILVTVCLLLAFRDLTRNEYRAGVWFALALIKPSMTLPFLILPLVRQHWRTLTVAIGLHVASTALQAFRFGVAPWELLGQWTGVAAYFTQGQFTLQEVLSAWRLADSAAGLAVVAMLVLFAAGWCLWNRAAGDDLLIDWLCFVSVLWTYHGPYDFVVLLIPLVRRLGPAVAAVRNRPEMFFNVSLGTALFVFLSVATSPLVYGDEVHVAARLVRHAARLTLILSAAAIALDAWRSARSARAAGSPTAMHQTVSRQEPIELPAA